MEQGRGTNVRAQPLLPELLLGPGPRGSLWINVPGWNMASDIPTRNRRLLLQQFLLVVFSDATNDSHQESNPDALGKSSRELVHCWCYAHRYGWNGSVITLFLRLTQISWRLCLRAWKHTTMPGRKIDSKPAVWLLVANDVNGIVHAGTKTGHWPL